MSSGPNPDDIQLDFDYDDNRGGPAANAAHAADDGSRLSPLEQQVLDEYALLVENLNHMSALVLDLSNAPSAAILDGLRGLERKTSLVYTLLKASVYSIVLNQEIGVGSEGEEGRDDDDEEEEEGGDGRSSVGYGG
ncbi:hypothetical protein ACEQ8H_005351 [Pleosporales sp. CAS-2024a]